MTTLRNRSWSVQIGTVRASSPVDGAALSVKFDVQKSTEREPNSASIKIANLSRDRRRALESADEPTIELRAGYVGIEDLIFAGDARDIWSERDGADVWTTIEAEDGGRSYRRAVYEQRYPPGTSASTVIRDLAGQLGVGIGNAAQLVAAAELDESGPRFGSGLLLTGLAWRSMDRICRSCSLRWSVQSGVLQLRRAGQPAESRAIRLSPDTGLVGSPTRGKRDDRTGRAAHGVKALLIPSLYPGRVVSIESDTLEGAFMVRRVSYIGDSTGQDWYADLEVEEY